MFIFNKIKTWGEDAFVQGWSAPAYQGFDWNVATFAVGIALYFYLPFEPSWGWALGICVGTGALFWMTDRFVAPLRKAAFILFLIALGVGRSTWHTAEVNIPKIPYERSYNVTGWIEALEKSGTGFRWRIRVSDMSGLDKNKLPKRVRVKAKPGEFKVGDAIRIRAIISPPPGPVVPGGYDPARRAFFEKIGGYGFAIGRPERADVRSQGFIEISQRNLARFRYGLAERIRARAPPETAGLQAALLTGIRTFIPPEQTEALRVAGLAHVLAISGLHMGLLAGGSYWLATLFLVCIPALSRRYDVRKPAAIIGALTATAYLILSGGSVATQRAYIMAIIVFLAVVLDRRAFSMRSVAVAALITLLLHPESLISVGFQMSFAAVAALVVVYREWQDRREYKPVRGIADKIGRNFAGLTTTSFVAGTATSAFAVLHFNRIASYSLLGNILAMPIFSFIVMPSALAALILMPLGLETVPLAVMGWGLSILIKVSEWVAGLDGAMVYVAAAPAWLIGLFGLGFLWLTLGQNLRRMAGGLIAVICFMIWNQTPQPDMRISDAGQVAFWGEGAKVLYVGRKRADRYGREQFLQRSGRPQSEMQSYQDTLALCDNLACRFEVKGRSVSVIGHPSEVIEECDAAELVILTLRRAGPVARRGCKAILIDEKVLKISGAHDVYMTDEGIELRPANTLGRRKRPWS